jgi:hypothetical protein
MFKKWDWRRELDFADSRYETVGFCGNKSSNFINGRELLH